MTDLAFEYRFKLRLHDVDHAGVMFFARLFVHAHDAYEAFMTTLGVGLDALIRDGVRLPVAHAEADYLGPMRHGEEIAVTVAIERLGRTSFAVGCAFIVSGDVRARVRTVHVFLDPECGSPAPLPDRLRLALVPYQAPSRA